MNRSILTLMALSSQHLFILRDPTSTSKTPNCRVLGFLKVGVKDLFFHDETGNWSEKLQPFCLLDFYVHESEQRRGRGLELIDTLLKGERESKLTSAIYSGGGGLEQEE